jgi:hypothetical protein
MKNKERAARAENALREGKYIEPHTEAERIEGGYIWSPIIDLLSDLRHYCEARRLNFSECDRIAKNHFNEESKSKSEKLF